MIHLIARDVRDERTASSKMRVIHEGWPFRESETRFAAMSRRNDQGLWPRHCRGRSAAHGSARLNLNEHGTASRASSHGRAFFQQARGAASGSYSAVADMKISGDDVISERRTFNECAGTGSAARLFRRGLFLARVARVEGSRLTSALSLAICLSAPDRGLGVRGATLRCNPMRCPGRLSSLSSMSPSRRRTNPAEAKLQVLRSDGLEFARVARLVRRSAYSHPSSSPRPAVPPPPRR